MTSNDVCVLCCREVSTPASQLCPILIQSSFKYKIWMCWKLIRQFLGLWNSSDGWLLVCDALSLELCDRHGDNTEYKRILKTTFSLCSWYLSATMRKDDPSENSNQPSFVFIVQEIDDEPTAMMKELFHLTYESHRPAHIVLHHTATPLRHNFNNSVW